MDYYEQLAARPSYQDSLKVLEADIQHANMLWVNPFSFSVSLIWFFLFRFDLKLGLWNEKHSDGFLNLYYLWCNSLLYSTYTILSLKSHCALSKRVHMAMRFYFSVKLVLFLMGWFLLFYIQGLLFWGWNGLFLWQRKGQREMGRVCLSVFFFLLKYRFVMGCEKSLFSDPRKKRMKKSVSKYLKPFCFCFHRYAIWISVSRPQFGALIFM